VPRDERVRLLTRKDADSSALHHECDPLVQWKKDMPAEVVDAIPLSKDAHGVYRVGGSRVTLDLVVRAFNRGATPEEIAQDFPSLQLPDIYQVIGYYLKHGSELAEYFDRRNREEQEMLEAHRDEWSPRGLRERLLARRANR
jgi:uncharacterized protein (DUF433 family)